MRIAAADSETTLIQKDGSTDTMWMFGWKELDTGTIHRYEPFRGQEEKDRLVAAAGKVDLWVGHNFLDFDVPQVHKHVKPMLIDPYRVVDTLVLSRLFHYDISAVKECSGGPHSLEAWGRRLKVHKGSFNNFNEYSQEMVDYWEGDLHTTEALYKHFLKYINDPDWAKAMRCEHDVQIELTRQRYYGFEFDKTKAEGLLTSVLDKMSTLEDELSYDFPPKLKLDSVLQYRMVSTTESWPIVDGVAVKDVPDGMLVDRYKGGQKAGLPKYKKVTIPNAVESQTVVDAKERYDMTTISGTDLLCYNYHPFKPGSPVDRIDVLNDAKWKPFDKTVTHQRFSRLKVGDRYGKKIDSMSKEFYNEKKAHLNKYGWAVNEDNLATLPDNAPEGAKKLAQWLTLEGRRSSLVEWIGQVREDGRIHGSTQSIGAWTGRCSHKNPNTANIASPFHGTPTTPVEEIKDKYDLSMRACWTVPSGSWLVGTDADGIQLRVLADYLWRHFDAEMYANAIMEGKKENETDIHNLNKRALGVSHATRDMAKTFIYSWLLGAGPAKTASILGVTVPQAVTARTSFENNVEGLKRLKTLLIPRVAKQGYFKGYDGRKVVVPSEYHTLAGILQSGEAVLMKHTMIKWIREAKKEGINFKPVGFIHDEWQCEVIGEKDEAIRLGEIQARCMMEVGQELGFKIPTPGSYDVGKNWYETH